MTYRSNEKKCIIYPENRKKGIWDLSITILLLISSIMIPLQIAFIKKGAKGTSGFMIWMYIIDVSFFLDILVTFNSAFYDIDQDLIDDRKEIAKNYLFGWFTIDLVAIIPFDILLENIAS